jgi:hypothetical protein
MARISRAERLTVPYCASKRALHWPCLTYIEGMPGLYYRRSLVNFLESEQGGAHLSLHTPSWWRSFSASRLAWLATDSLKFDSSSWSHRERKRLLSCCADRYLDQARHLEEQSFWKDASIKCRPRGLQSRRVWTIRAIRNAQILRRSIGRSYKRPRMAWRRHYPAIQRRPWQQATYTYLRW